MKTNKLLLFTLLLIVSFSSLSLRQKAEMKPEPKAKYVFLFIGDGMGLNHVMITNEYLKLHKQPEISFLSFKNLALTTTFPADSNKITDSAAAGTAIACSRKTSNGVLGQSSNGDEKFESIAELAKGNGMKVGILSTVGLNHATPAAFYANQPKRSMYNEIAMEMSTSNFDFFGGGGIISKSDADFDQAISKMKENKYTILDKKTSFDPKANYGDKLYYSLFSELVGAAIPYRIDQEATQSNLSDFVEFGIQYLDNPKGFFMMAEGGKIDWASHGNDGATAVHEVIDFDLAVQKALEFYKKHPKETLIIVTADHETGGLSFGSDALAYTTNFKNLDGQKVSEGVFTNLLKESNSNDYLSLIEKNYGLKISFSTIEPLNEKAISDKVTTTIDNNSGIAWTTHAHTGVPVVTYAIGPGSEQFNGIIDNTDISKFIRKATGLD